MTHEHSFENILDNSFHSKRSICIEENEFTTPKRVPRPAQIKLRKPKLLSPYRSPQIHANTKQLFHN
jgi:hypothetical protein